MRKVNKIKSNNQTKRRKHYYAKKVAQYKDAGETAFESAGLWVLLDLLIIVLSVIVPTLTRYLSNPIMISLMVDPIILFTVITFACGSLMKDYADNLTALDND